MKAKVKSKKAKVVLLLLVLVCFFLLTTDHRPPTTAQTLGTQVPGGLATLQNAATATGNGTAIQTRYFGGVICQVTGTFSATITFEATVDETNWVSVNATNLSTGADGTTATAAGLYFANLPGVEQFRARVSSYTSGSVTVQARLVPSVAKVSRGAGSVSGTGTANAIPKFSAGNVLSNSNLSDNGSAVVSAIRLQLNGDLFLNNQGGLVFKDGAVINGYHNLQVGYGNNADGAYLASAFLFPTTAAGSASDTGLARDVAGYTKPSDGSTGNGGFSLYPVSGNPASPASSTEAHLYLKGSKLIFDYNDAGTRRWKYLDLTGTGVTWVATTVAP